MLAFYEEGHLYKSLPEHSQVDWLGVTTLVGSLKEPFNKEEKATKCSTRKPGKYPNKWYGTSKEDILQAWDNENKRATTLGHKYHAIREQELLNREVVEGIPVVRSQIIDGVKIAPNQVLSEGIYPEHLVYLQSAGVCGQADIVEVRDGVLNIRDYKTSKEITTEGFTSWDGTKKKMSPPVQHLEDCHTTHYAIQLSIYMFIILRHNPALKPGKLIIDHVKFEESGRDKWDYPIHTLDENGEPIMKEIVPIEVPYLKNEVIKLMEHVKKNRHKIVKH